MKKAYSLFILLLLAINTAFGKNEQPSPEDLEISKLKSQIKLLQNRVKTLEEAKKAKDTKLSNKKAPAKSLQTKSTLPKINETDKNKKAPKVGLALSGGGAKGLIHVGVLKELERNNIKIDYITGTSIGAIVGAMYTTGYTPDQIESYLSKIDWRNIITGDGENSLIPLERKFNKFDYMITLRYDKKFKFSAPKAFRDNQTTYIQLKNVLNNSENINNFDDLPIPMRVVATDLNSGRSVSFSKGDLARSVTASSAIPTVFEPVSIDNRLYVDGLISQNFPVQEAFDMGADVVIGSNVGNALKDNEDYSIVSVVNQLMAIPSAYSTETQKNLATILISPDVSKYSATDVTNSKKFVEIGEEATREKLQQLNKLAKRQVPLKKLDPEDTFYISDIVFEGNILQSKEIILRELLKDLRSRTIKHTELEKKMMQIYGLDFIDSVYYKVDNNILYVDPIINPSNTLGFGVNYRTGYGTTLNIGTEFSNVGKLGSSTFINAKLGDFLGIEGKNFFYYGTSNKLGIFVNGIAKESPLYVYSGSKKIAEFLKTTGKVEVGIAAQLDNKLFLTYGIDSGYYKLDQKIDSNIPNMQNAQYSKNINNAFFKATYDQLNSIKHPTSGYKLDFNYLMGGNFNKKGSNYYGALQLFNVFLPVTNNTTLKLGLSGGVLSGDNIFLDQYIKIGGMNDDIENAEFSFAGYNLHQKLVKQFAIGTVEIEQKVITNLYLNGKWNFGTFEEVGSPAGNFHAKNMWKYPVQGFGIGALYESLIGPIEFQVSKDSKKGRIVSQVSIGYTF